MWSSGLSVRCSTTNPLLLTRHNRDAYPRDPPAPTTSAPALLWGGVGGLECASHARPPQAVEQVWGDGGSAAVSLGCVKGASPNGLPVPRIATTGPWRRSIGPCM